MRLLFAILAVLVGAAPSAAQWADPRPLPVTPAPFPWNPTADYIEAGQDEPGYRLWTAQANWRGSYVGQFHRYLEAAGVAWVAPTWQLLRTASDWRRCGAPPFEVPPMEDWPNVVNTLRYVRDYVVPVIGPVEPVSVFRNTALNRCAGGAPQSVHQHMSAIDFVPLRPIGRDEMIRRLCAVHQREGMRFNAGLGFYTKMRFHIDTSRYRTWGRNDRGDTACPAIPRPPMVIARAPTEPVSTNAPVTPPATVPAPAVTTRPVLDIPIGELRTDVIGPPAPQVPTTDSQPQKDPLAPL